MARATASKAYGYDLFLAYDLQDQRVVARLAERLRGTGLRVWFDRWEIHPGDNVDRKVAQGLRESRILVLCLSKAALSTGWAELDREHKFFEASAGVGRRVIPLLIERYDQPNPIEQLEPIDYQGESEASFERLAAACRLSDNDLASRDHESASHRSVLTFAGFALVAFMCCVGILLLLVLKGEWLVRLGLEGRLFYVSLLPLGVFAALVLFGVLRSHAAYNGKVNGGSLELRGPIVVFVLVVLGGFWLVPNPSSFMLTVYLHGGKGPHDEVLRNRGAVLLDFGPDRRREQIGDKGEARFVGIPSAFRGQTIPVDIDAPGYELLEDKHVMVGDEAIYLTVRLSELTLAVGVKEAGDPRSGVQVDVPAYQLSTMTDATGYATLRMRGRPGEEVDLVISDPPRHPPRRETAVLGGGNFEVDLGSP